MLLLFAPKAPGSFPFEASDLSSRLPFSCVRKAAPGSLDAPGEQKSHFHLLHLQDLLTALGLLILELLSDSTKGLLCGKTRAFGAWKVVKTHELSSFQKTKVIGFIGFAYTMNSPVFVVSFAIATSARKNSSRSGERTRTAVLRDRRPRVVTSRDAFDRNVQHHPVRWGITTI